MANKVRLNVGNLIKIIKNVKITVSGKDGLLDIARTWRTRIQGFTRAGKDLTGGSPNFSIVKKVTRQPALKGSTIVKRFRFAQKNAVHPSFKHGFSNLTMTGDLLEGLQVSAEGQRQRVSVSVGGKRRDGEDNRQIARDLAGLGRYFLGLDQAGAKTLSVKARRNILRQLKNLLRSR